MMPLSAGTRLGLYEIVGPLGAGGMGEVYRAHDTQLGRDVAIKILPEAFAIDPDRVARFEREAQLLAALNHPHIAAIYGLEASQGSRFLVLELVEGETLAQRLTAGALPVGDALKIARQIVDALEAAHEKGIIHRDLKPANIALTADGQVKVLDFGLAKLEAGSASLSGEREGGAAGVAHSPTLTFAATQAGVILGTAAYMSPEQAKGRVADKRSDVWAFGCVLYEMLTGKRAFEGEDVSETLAAILRGEPDWKALPADVPPHIRTLLKRCVEKDRKARIADVSTVRYVMDETPAGGSPAATSVAPQKPGRPGVVIAAGVALLACVSAVATWIIMRPAPAPARAALRLTADLGADASLWISNSGAAAVLSPDGSMLAFVAQRSAGKPQLFVRRLDQLQATPLSGTDEATSPFFSPDGQWIAFFAEQKLKKISVTGGAAVTLADAPLGKGGSWADDGTIVFSPANSSGTTLLRVSAAGGKAEPVSPLAQDEVTQRFPQVLPGGKAVLFMGHNGTRNYEDANLVVQTLPSGPRKVVVRGGYYGRYLPSGHLTYIHEGTLFAVPFDLGRLETTGQPVPAIEGVSSGAGAGAGAQVAVSTNGTLVYLPGGTVSNGAPVHWVDRDGKTTFLRAAASNWSNVAFAPDGRRLALDINDGRQTDVWIYEWARDTLSRFTFDPANDEKPVWTPDGRRIVFASVRGRLPSQLYWQRADGTGEVQRLTDSKNPQFPASWHPSGKFLAFVRAHLADGHWI